VSGGIGGERFSSFCETETFNASCRTGHVIVMTHARYGRMSLSRCVKMDYGHIGCAADVIRQADWRCSGRRRCNVRVPDAEFARDKPCPDDLKPYLEAAYVCVRGMPTAVNSEAYLFFIRPHRIHEMRTIATDDPVAWCVSQSFCLSRVCTLQNGWMDQDPAYCGGSWCPRHVVLAGEGWEKIWPIASYLSATVSIHSPDVATSDAATGSSALLKLGPLWSPVVMRSVFY